MNLNLPLLGDFSLWSYRSNQQKTSQLAELDDCYFYIRTLSELGNQKTVPDMLENTAFVFLGRADRIRLSWRIFKSTIHN